MTLKLIAASACLALAASAANATQLDLLLDNNPNTLGTFKSLTAAYSKLHPDVTFQIETRPGGSEGDNILKTRMATGDMPDIFNYNSGSLLQALRPSRTLMPINDIPNIKNLKPSFVKAVSDAQGNIYGVPIEPAMGGGILYNIPIYKKLGLSVPKTWDQFMANNEKIKKETDVTPIAETYRDAWTSQIFVLADFYNVVQKNPDFAKNYTANKAKFANTPAALKGFEHLKQTHDAGFFNKDFGAANYEDGLRMVATGKAAHYPMLTFSIGALEQNEPDNLKDVGFFALPGDNAEKNGLTIWLPGALYIPKSTRHPEIAKDFANFIASKAGCDALLKGVGANGPLMVDGCKLPANVPPSVKDMEPYFNEKGRTYPALEFLSPVKGPTLEQLTVEVGSGIRSPEDAAKLYDRDVAKQARQLGLPGW